MADAVLADGVTHLIVTNEGRYGLSAESPQVPGLCFSRPTETEFRRDYKGVLRDIGVTGRVQSHRQVRGSTEAGGEYLIRWVDGQPDQAERQEVVRRIEGCLFTEQAADMLDTEKTPMGEVVFVASLPGDRLGPLMEQLYDDGDALVVCAAIAEEALFTMTLASGKRTEAGWQSLEDNGWSRETTISELLHDWARGHRAERILI